MIRLFHANPRVSLTLDADNLNLELHCRGLPVTVHYPGSRWLGSIHDWIADVHPTDLPIILGIGDGAAYACDLAALADLWRHPRGAVIAVDVPTLTHPIRSRLTWLLPARVPCLPAGVTGALVTDPDGAAAFRGGIRDDIPARWAYRISTTGSTRAHRLDAIAEAIKRVDKGGSKVLGRPIASVRRIPPTAIRILPPLDAPAVA